MKKIIFILLSMFFITGCKNNEELKVEESNNNSEVVEKENTNTAYITDTIEIKKVAKNDYEFVYNGETFKASYLTDTWKIYNSYKIVNSSDIKKICKALIEIKPVYGSDMVSYRTETDMAYEWVQHNLAYELLPEGNSFKDSAKDVDLDPKDQGKTLVEMYEERTGHTLDLSNLINEKINSSKNS